MNRKELHQIELEQFEKSSSYNNKILLFFISFLFYVAIIVAATTDLQLFLTNSEVVLPLLNVKLPLFAFFVVTPALITLFLFYLHFNLYQHAFKLKTLQELGYFEQSMELPPFFFNYFSNYNKKNMGYFLFRTMIWAIYYFIPLLLLLFIQIRFSDYHSISITAWHSFLVFISIFLIIFYWFKVINRALTNEKYDSIRELWIYYTGDSLKSLISIKMMKLRSLVILITSFLSILNLLSLILINLSPNILNRISSYWLIPKIEINEKNLVLTPPGDEILQRYLALGKNKEDAWNDFAVGIDLSKRNLEYCILNKCTLIKADFRASNLAYANFNECNINNANFDFADLTETYFQNSELMQTRFVSSKTKETSFLDCNLNYSSFLTNFYIDDYSNAPKFLSSSLNGSFISGLRFTKSNQMHNTTLVAANVTNCIFDEGFSANNLDLSGGYIGYSSMTKCSIKESRFHGCILTRINFSTTIFDSCYLNDSYMYDCMIDNTKFNRTNIENHTIDTNNNTILINSKLFALFDSFLLARESLIGDDMIVNENLIFQLYSINQPEQYDFRMKFIEHLKQFYPSIYKNIYKSAKTRKLILPKP